MKFLFMRIKVTFMNKKLNHQEKNQLEWQKNLLFPSIRVSWICNDFIHSHWSLSVCLSVYLVQKLFFSKSLHPTTLSISLKKSGHAGLLNIPTLSIPVQKNHISKYTPPPWSCLSLKQFIQFQDSEFCFSFIRHWRRLEHVWSEIGYYVTSNDVEINSDADRRNYVTSGSHGNRADRHDYTTSGS